MAKAVKAAKLPKKPGLSYRIMVRITEPQRQQLIKEAVKRGTSESGLMRMWVVEKLAELRG